MTDHQSQPIPQALYTAEALAACEKALLTLAAKVGEWGASLILFGGLAPRYIVDSIPENLEPHLGTTDLDVVIGVALDSSGEEFYSKLQKELERAGFSPNIDEEGQQQSFAWQRRVDDIKVILEFFCPVEEGGTPGRLLRNPGGSVGSRISAIQLKGAEIADLDCSKHTLEGDVLDQGGRRSVDIRVVNILPFLILKAFALESRDKPKDAYDIVWTLSAYGSDGSKDAAKDCAQSPIRGSDAADEATELLRQHFATIEHAGPSNYAKFFLGVTENAETRDQYRRFAAGIVGEFLQAWDLLL